MLTYTEENYLKSIYHLYEQTKESVATNSIARHLNTTAASVTDMMKKLASKDLIDYEKYKGTKLSSSGYAIATALIRRHRLWETFLVEKLAFSWEEVHELAEELEHIKSEKLGNRLDAYLDYPKFDPHGDPIPNAEGRFTLRDQISLDQLDSNDRGQIVAVKLHDPQFLSHLNELDISIGTKIKVLTKNRYDRSLRIHLDDMHEQTITEKVSRNILIKKDKSND